MYPTGHPSERRRGLVSTEPIDETGRTVADGGSERATRTSPYHDRQQALEAVFYDNHGWAAVAWYGRNERRVADYEVPAAVAESRAIGVEHLATRETVACYDLTPHRPIEIRGDGASEFLQRQLTSDMAIAVGRVRFAMLLAEDGGILADLVVTRLNDDRYLAVAGPAASHVVERLRGRAPTDVTVVDRDDDYVGIGLWGPNARAMARGLTAHDMSDDAFPFLTAERIQLGGVPVIAMRLSAAGELGWELWAPMRDGATLWDELWDAGPAFGLVGLGDRAFASLTAEKGNREWGNDVRPEHDPYEAGLGHAVDMETDFVGKSALGRVLDEGIDRRLACLTLDRGRLVPEVGSTVAVRGEAVGEVVRSEYGYSVDESIAFGYLPVEYTKPMTSVEVEIADGRYPATVRDEPLFDEDNERLLT